MNSATSPSTRTASGASAARAAAWSSTRARRPCCERPVWRSTTRVRPHPRRPHDPVALLAERAGAGHPPTLAALDRAGRALGLALTSAVDLIDPDGLVLGGTYAELAAWLLPSVRAELTDRVTVRPWAPEALRSSALGRRGPVLGAAQTTIRRIMADPTLLSVG